MNTGQWQQLTRSDMDMETAKELGERLYRQILTEDGKAAADHFAVAWSEMMRGELGYSDNQESST